MPETPEIQEELPLADGTAEIDASEKKEEQPMFREVHAPHESVHSWKDAFIHIAIIVVGLLIAVGLEQTVEWVHHLHQRHTLEENLRQEGSRNQNYAKIDIAVYDKVIAWLLQIQRGVDQARATGGKATFVYPARPDGIPDSPRVAAYHILETEAWTTAKESSLLVLLPRDEAEIYARLYIQSDLVESSWDHMREFGEQQGAFETRFSHGTYPPVFDLSTLTPQQLDEYDALLADELEAVRIARLRVRIFAAANEYVLSGGVSEDDLRKAILKENLPQ